ncbi:MAG: TlpA family protein disulfide reductase, partial [Aquificae bacterium]|nr:TlpA family protein disulfide reductase [Aquificota bacterium]
MNNKLLATLFGLFLAFIVSFVFFFALKEKSTDTSSQTAKNNVEEAKKETKKEEDSKGLDLDEKKLSDFIGKEQINFHGIDETGKEVDMKSITQGKPAVIIFFAIGDKPGTFDFLPNMNKLYDKYKDKVQFVAVLLSRSDAEEVKELKEMLPLKIPVLLGYSDAIKGYEISKVDVPFIVIVDANGKVKHIVVRPESEMIEEAPYVDHKDYKN